MKRTTKANEKKNVKIGKTEGEKVRMNYQEQAKR